MPKKLTDEEIGQIRSSRAVRMELAEKSLVAFMHLYFPQYMFYKSAPFHHEIYNTLQNDDESLSVMIAFRGSGKSTIVSQGYPIWSILKRDGKKFIVLASQTQQQAQQHLRNIKNEFEANSLLIKDFGPLSDEPGEWGSTALEFPKYNARIIAVSVEQSIRGLRHGPHRPDLIICDDVEDMSSVKTQAGRNKVYDWFTGEVLPIGDVGTKIVVIGNLLHEDSLLMRLKDGIDSSNWRAASGSIQ